MATDYQSEISIFLAKYRKTHPDIEQRQREGRNRLWDQPQNLSLQEDFQDAHVAQKSYVYFSD